MPWNGEELGGKKLLVAGHINDGERAGVVGLEGVIGEGDEVSSGEKRGWLIQPPV